jgi:hypothetical protein
MDLAALIRKYLEEAGGFGCAVHLSRFGMPKAETEKIFAAFDEDYQISRYMFLSRERNESLGDYPEDARVYCVNGVDVTHVTINPEMRTLL